MPHISCDPKTGQPPYCCCSRNIVPIVVPGKITLVLKYNVINGWYRGHNVTALQSNDKSHGGCGQEEWKTEAEFLQHEMDDVMIDTLQHKKCHQMKYIVFKCFVQIKNISYRMFCTAVYTFTCIRSLHASVQEYQHTNVENICANIGVKSNRITSASLLVSLPNQHT